MKTFIVLVPVLTRAYIAKGEFFNYKRVNKFLH